MKKTGKAATTALVVLLFLVISILPAQAKDLKTEEARACEVTGTFTLVLYGARHIDDLETVAFLDKEGDQYEFEPYAPEFDYRVEKGIPALDALQAARKFVSFHNAFWRSQLSKILDEKGNVIGYEVRPLYRPFVFGRSDLLDVYYRIKDGKVIAYIKLRPDVSGMFFFGDKHGNSLGTH